MNTEELRRLKDALISDIETTFSDIQTSHEAYVLASTVATDTINTLTTQLVESEGREGRLQQRIAELEGQQSTTSTSSTPQTHEGTTVPPMEEVNTLTMPPEPNTDVQVRFLSRTSGMGGLANIRASMQDLGVNAKRLRLQGSSYTPSPTTLIINWGGGYEVPSNIEGHTGRWLNNLANIKVAANKLKTFEALADNNSTIDIIPQFTADKNEAVEANWDKTYVRSTLYGHSGEGISVINYGDVLPNAPLYVEGLAIRHEYRVHTVNGYTKIQKKAALDTENPNQEVRNLAGGWTFINEFTLGERGRRELHTLAVDVLRVLGLDFGAVDVVRTMDGEWKVLEVNTAPGVTADSNIEWYTKALLAG